MKVRIEVEGRFPVEGDATDGVLRELIVYSDKPRQIKVYLIGAPESDETCKVLAVEPLPKKSRDESSLDPNLMYRYGTKLSVPRKGPNGWLVDLEVYIDHDNRANEKVAAMVDISCSTGTTQRNRRIAATGETLSLTSADKPRVLTFHFRSVILRTTSGKEVTVTPVIPEQHITLPGIFQPLRDKNFDANAGLFANLLRVAREWLGLSSPTPTTRRES